MQPRETPYDKFENRRVLTVNGGSSGIKFALFDTAGGEITRVFSGAVDRPGTSAARFELRHADGRRETLAGDFSRPGDAVAALLKAIGPGEAPAIGHRLVHGGPDYAAPVLITPEVLTILERYAPLDPRHLPAELRLVRAFTEALPGSPQIACFDTDFHRDLPVVATLLPVPRRLFAKGVRRYGFHGLSYDYLLGATRRDAPELTAGRLIFAHLGGGASLAAVRAGRCVDTTMGFTPTGGVPMGTRSGDLDPGLVIYLMREEKLSVDAFDRMVNGESGLLGLSETSSDVRDLLAAEATDIRAREALDVFCYRIRREIGSLAAAMGGIDGLVFAGGVGENSPAVRARICEGLGFLDITLDPERNAAGAGVISAAGRRVAVRVTRTDEEAVIARDVLALLSSSTR